MSKYRKLMIIVALVAALTMFATMTSVSFAALAAALAKAKETTCVYGYVINHREQPVDGTKLIRSCPSCIDVPGTDAVCQLWPRRSRRLRR